MTPRYDGLSLIERIALLVAVVSVIVIVCCLCACRSARFCNPANPAPVRGERPLKFVPPSAGAVSPAPSPPASTPPPDCGERQAPASLPDGEIDVEECPDGACKPPSTARVVPCSPAPVTHAHASLLPWWACSWTLPIALAVFVTGCTVSFIAGRASR